MYCNCNCNCSCSKNCTYNFNTTDVTINNDNVILQLPQFALNNGNKLKLCIKQNITGTLPVLIQFGEGTPIPLINRCGKAIISDQLRVNRRYYIIIGTSTPIGVLLNCNALCPTSYIYPQLLPDKPPATPTFFK